MKMIRIYSICYGVYNVASITTDNCKIFYKTEFENDDDDFNETILFLNKYKNLSS
jgi:hypothetical protein